MFVAIPIALLVLALLLQPIAQKRRENAIFEQIKTRDPNEAKALAESALHSQQQKAELPEKWYDS